MLCVNIAFFALFGCHFEEETFKLSRDDGTSLHKITAPISIVRNKKTLQKFIANFHSNFKSEHSGNEWKQRMQIFLTYSLWIKMFYTVIQKFQWKGLEKIREDGKNYENIKPLIIFYQIKKISHQLISSVAQTPSLWSYFNLV